MNQTGFHVLIVDDVFLNIHLLDNLLRKEGHTFSFASDGEGVFEIVHKESVDLILLDIMMPGMDGYQICRKLKADERTKDIPVIFLTAKADKQDVVEGFSAGGVDYIVKPFHAAELTARIKIHLELKSAKNRAEQFADSLAETNERLIRQNEQIQKAAEEIRSLKSILATCDACKSKLPGLQG